MRLSADVAKWKLTIGKSRTAQHTISTAFADVIETMCNLNFENEINNTNLNMRDCTLDKNKEQRTFGLCLCDFHFFFCVTIFI